MPRTPSTLTPRAFAHPARHRVWVESACGGCLLGVPGNEARELWDRDEEMMNEAELAEEVRWPPLCVSC